MNPCQATRLKYPIFIPAFTGVGLWFSDTLNAKYAIISNIY
jgi:hypothetical protein